MLELDVHRDVLAALKRAEEGGHAPILAEPELPEPACRVCGCTHHHPCEGGCHWVSPGLCSRCAQGGRFLTPDPVEVAGVTLHDGMAEAERAFRHRGELSFYWGGDGAALVMARDVQYEADGIPRVRGGHVLTREALDQLIRGVQGAAPTRTVLPPHVIMWDGLRVAWWVPTARRRIWFDEKTRPELALINRQEVTHPPLLFIADPGHLQLYALPANERPTAATPVYQAPYFNVYDTGGVCAGKVAWPKTLDVEKLAQWETAFFDSVGTNPTARRLTLYPGGTAKLWAAMLEAGAFPLDSLVPLGLTVLDVINHTETPRTDPFVREEIVPELPALEGEQDAP